MEIENNMIEKELEQMTDIELYNEVKQLEENIDFIDIQNEFIKREY